MDLKELEGNRYYKLVKVEDKEQLEEIGWDWLLGDYDFEQDLKGNYFVTEEEREEVKGEEVEVPVVYTVDRYLYIESSKAIECDGALWLSEEEMEKPL